MKSCNKCKEEKQDAEFYKKASSCKACVGLAAAAWAKANPDKRKATCVKYRIKHAEKVKATADKHYKENKEKMVLRAKEWASNNPSKVRLAKNKWAEANRDAYRIYSHNRRSRERDAVGTLSTDIAKKLFSLQRGKCACCARPLGNKYHRDHRMPLALGGSNTDDNIELLCPTCNLQKQAKHPIDFMQSRGFLL